LTNEVDSKLKEHMKIVDKRTFEDYAKIEGMISSGVSLPDGKVIIT